MRILPALAIFGLVTFASLTHAQSANLYQVHKLILTSNDLPTVECDAIVRAFQGGTYALENLAERIRFKLREDGYSLAEVGEAQVTQLNSTRHPAADIRYYVHAGSRYRLGQITFQVGPGESVFSSTQLRAQFPIQDGEIFSDQQIGDGLNKLRDLYVSAGYANVATIPKPVYDRDHESVTLTIEVDPGNHRQ
jgi:outer membrane protein assembly factor BamA